jgi:hypothetical protein
MSSQQYNFQHYLDGVKAVSEALYFYKCLIIDWGYFANDLDVEYGSFSIDRYIDCDMSTDTLSDEDQSFLREASAIKLICKLQDSILINEGLVDSSKCVKLAKKLLKELRLVRVGRLGLLIEELLMKEYIEPELAKEVFDEFVLTKFKTYLGFH